MIINYDQPFLVCRLQQRVPVLQEIRGMTFPGHLDKASMIQRLEDFDALNGGEELHKDDAADLLGLLMGSSCEQRLCFVTS